VQESILVACELVFRADYGLKFSWSTEGGGDMGIQLVGTREAKRRIAAKAMVRFKRKVRELTSRTRGISMEQMAKELASYLRGWKGYFGFCETPSVLERLDQWTRQRLRSVIWKQWKRGGVRFARLHQRGVSRDLAAQTAGSSHGPCESPTVLR